MRIVARVRAWVRRWIIELLTHLLTKPRRVYDQRIPNSLSHLKQALRAGDVILVEGDQRISQVIRYLTQSPWSHSALYVGDELRRLQPALADELAAEHGEDARHLVIESIAGDGVVCTPIAKYARFNLRVCRPRGLRREDLDRVLMELIGQLGLEYDVKHIFDLGRYFFPVRLIPRRFRRAALHYGADSPREVICSTMLARAFANIGYPVLPRVTIDQIAAQTTWRSRLLRRNGHTTRALYREEDPALITPRDFDLSPYFEIVKFNHLVTGKFDYRQIEWLRSEHASLPDEANDDPEGVAVGGARP